MGLRHDQAGRAHNVAQITALLAVQRMHIATIGSGLNPAFALRVSRQLS